MRLVIPFFAKAPPLSPSSSITKSKFPFSIIYAIFFFIVFFSDSFIRTEASCNASDFASNAKNDRKFFNGISIIGSGFIKASLMKRTCFSIKTKNKFGKAYDEGCKQKTFFTVFLTSTKEKIQMMANVKYMKSKSVHRVCYKIPISGIYNLNIYLLFFDAYKIRNKILKAKGFNSYKKNFVVAKSVIVVNETKRKLNRNGLPVCTFALLSASNNEGYWKQNQWMPHACNAPKMFPKNIKKCLKGKRILILGDSQMRYTFSELMTFLRFNKRCDYLSVSNKSRKYSKINSFGRKENRMDIVTKDANVVITKTGFGLAREVLFFGNYWDGFAKTRQRRVWNASKVEDEDMDALDLTYVVHLNVDKEAIDDWMKSEEGLNGYRVKDDVAFDHVFVASGLHDVGHFHSPSDFAHALKNIYIPSLLKLVRSPNHIVWLGTWSAQESQKSRKFLPKSNNVRGFAFDDKAKGILREMGINYWIDSRYMTLPRKDLCLDSTHYAWPVTFSSLELWLGMLCNQVVTDSEEPSC